MVDVNDDAKGGRYRRVEVLTGPGRRRKWSDDDKARIVAETLEPGAVAAEVARRWQICPQQVFTWQREMRAGAAARLDFVPIVPTTSMALPEPPTAPASSSPSIEVKVAGTVLRVTITRNCAGITSSRSEVSAPISHHRRRAAGAGGSLGHQHDLDARQVDGQRAAAGTTLRAALLPQFRIALLGLAARREFHSPVPTAAPVGLSRSSLHFHAHRENARVWPMF
jgi:transposase